MEYITVMGEGEAEFVEKKSRFIGTCRPVQTEEEALALGFILLRINQPLRIIFI